MGRLVALEWPMDAVLGSTVTIEWRARAGDEDSTAPGHAQWAPVILANGAPADKIANTGHALIAAPQLDSAAAIPAQLRIHGDTLLESRDFRIVPALPQDCFVRVLYRDLLGREPTAQEKDWYVGQLLDHRLSQEACAVAALHSPEFGDSYGFVVRLLIGLFSKSADPRHPGFRLVNREEIQYYLDRIRTDKWSGADVARAMMNSPEFEAAFGKPAARMNECEFAGAALNAALGRNYRQCPPPAGDTEVTSAAAQLKAGKAREALLAELARTPAAAGRLQKHIVYAACELGLRGSARIGRTALAQFISAPAAETAADELRLAAGALTSAEFLSHSDCGTTPTAAADCGTSATAAAP